MFRFEGKDLVISLVGVLGALDIVLVGTDRVLLDSGDLLLVLDDRVLGEKDLLTHDIDLALHELVPPDRVVQADLLIGQQVKDMSALDFLLVEVLFGGYHFFDFVLFLIELC